MQTRPYCLNVVNVLADKRAGKRVGCGDKASVWRLQVPSLLRLRSVAGPLINPEWNQLAQFRTAIPFVQLVDMVRSDGPDKLAVLMFVLQVIYSIPSIG